MDDARQTLVDNLETIDDVITFVCRRNRLSPTDADEFAAIVKLRLVENDYAIIRRFNGDCSFAGFISVVIHRLLLDIRVHEWGRWHASTEATRLGPIAVELERQIHREGSTQSEAVAIVLDRHPGMTLADLEALTARIPNRKPRHREVPLDDLPPVAEMRWDAVTAVSSDQERLASRVSAIVREFTSELPPEDQTILQFRFECAMTVAEIGRSLRIEQRSLYYRLDKWMSELRRRLEAAGVDAEDIRDLLESPDADLDFAFVRNIVRPSKQQETTAAGQEEISS